MKKFQFVLMAKGYRTQMTIAGQSVECPKMDAVYYSSIKHVYAVDQDHADDLIQAMLGRKWLGAKYV
jgi:hypothetical protein